MRFLSLYEIYDSKLFWRAKQINLYTKPLNIKESDHDWIEIHLQNGYPE